MKKLIIIFTVFSSNILLCQNVLEYYNEIATRAEYNIGKDTASFIPKRWKKDVKIFVKGIHDSVVEEELIKVVAELNELIETIEIQIVETESSANLIAFIGWGIDYDKFEPNAERFTGPNWGLACIYPGKDNDWIRGSFYVDVVRCNDHPVETATKLKKHILREELTQSLGLMNDSMKYPDSIFYQGWSMTISFLELDKQVIKMHYAK